MASGIYKSFILISVAIFLLLPVEIVYSQSIDPNSPYSGQQTEYTRPDADLDIPTDAPEIASNPQGGPEQVFLNQADNVGTSFTISWSSTIAMESEVFYSSQPDGFDLIAKGTSSKYTYADYTSGNLHHVTLSGLQHNTRYYYKVGRGDESYLIFKSQFTTPPSPGPDASLKFAVVGDLGQTYSSRDTLHNIIKSESQYLLNVGDFSYADGYQPRWDTWGRFMSNYTSKTPMLFTFGNHELEFDKAVNATEPPQGFLSANTRFSAPWKNSDGASGIYHSCNVGPAHIISLNSYVAITKYSPQYNWLQKDLESVNRTLTPWVIIITHVPWYNTYQAHYLEGEPIRTSVEYFVRKYEVDVILSGHVHAYERFKRVYEYQEDNCAPVYITIGDGGNREGPADKYELIPQPKISVYREPSFGYGSLDIKNNTHAIWEWHRNEAKGSESVVDKFVIESLKSSGPCPPPQPLHPPLYSSIFELTLRST